MRNKRRALKETNEREQKDAIVPSIKIKMNSKNKEVEATSDRSKDYLDLAESPEREKSIKNQPKSNITKRELPGRKSKERVANTGYGFTGTNLGRTSYPGVTIKSTFKRKDDNPLKIHLKLNKPIVETLSSDNERNTHVKGRTVMDIESDSSSDKGSQNDSVQISGRRGRSIKGRKSLRTRKQVKYNVLPDLELSSEESDINLVDDKKKTPIETTGLSKAPKKREKKLKVRISLPTDTPVMEPESELVPDTKVEEPVKGYYVNPELLPTDPEGELKVNPDGSLNDNRVYEFETHFIVSRPNQLFSFVTPVLKTIGLTYKKRVNDLFPFLEMVPTTQEDRDFMVERGSLPTNRRVHQTSMINSRLLFITFGYRVIKNGVPGIDDYYQSETSPFKDILDDIFKKIIRLQAPQAETPIADDNHSDSSLGLSNFENLQDTSIDSSGFFDLSFDTRLDPLAKSSSLYNSKLVSFRRSNLHYYDPHTNTYHVPTDFQPKCYTVDAKGKRISSYLAASPTLPNLTYVKNADDSACGIDKSLIDCLPDGMKSDLISHLQKIEHSKLQAHKLLNTGPSECPLATYEGQRVDLYPVYSTRFNVNVDDNDAVMLDKLKAHSNVFDLPKNSIRVNIREATQPLKYGTTNFSNHYKTISKSGEQPTSSIRSSNYIKPDLNCAFFDPITQRFCQVPVQAIGNLCSVHNQGGKVKKVPIDYNFLKMRAGLNNGPIRPNYTDIPEFPYNSLVQSSEAHKSTNQPRMNLVHSNGTNTEYYSKLKQVEKDVNFVIPSEDTRNLICGYYNAESGTSCQASLRKSGKGCVIHGWDGVNLQRVTVAPQLQPQPTLPTILSNKCPFCEQKIAPLSAWDKAVQDRTAEEEKARRQAQEAIEAGLPVPDSPALEAFSRKRSRKPRREETFRCSQCKLSFHLWCLGMVDGNITEQMKRYDWLCNNCKICEVCHSDRDQHKLMMCDWCDRGFHMDCCNPPVIILPRKYKCSKCP